MAFPVSDLINKIIKLTALASLVVLMSGCTRTYSTEVDTTQKISDIAGQFDNNLSDDDQFGSAIANVGDIEGDGIIDLAAGAPFDDDGAIDSGAVWILLLDIEGNVDFIQKISNNSGGFTSSLDNNDHFGAAITPLGDLNGDTFLDIAVGVPGDDDGGPNRGAVWILFLNPDGTVFAQQKISATNGGFTGALDDEDAFGTALASIGDVNGDGIDDIAVGTPDDDDGGTNRGAVWILLLNTDGTVANHQKISFDEGDFQGELADNDRFGTAIAGMGDIDGDGFNDLAVGVPGDDTAGTDRGAIWILFLAANYTVADEQKISQNDGEFDNFLFDGDNFGNSLANLGDMNNDGIDELAVGASLTDDGGFARGAFWVLFLRDDGTLISSSKISDLLGGFTEVLDDNDQFGFAIAALGDLDGDLVLDIVTSAFLDDDGGTDRGALWVLFMTPVEIGARFDRDATLFTVYGGGS